jgi:formylglycine-generating enzyme required for sulfatase activity
MPPEVLAGEVDAISGLGDQYALAVTLYEMIVGKRPFTGPTETAIYRAIEKGAKPLIEIKSGIPQMAADVVRRALNSDPSQRFKTCREFASAFVAGLRGGVVNGPSGVAGQGVNDADDGTRELNLEKYRDNLNKQKLGPGTSGRDSGGKLFPDPPKVPPKGTSSAGGSLPKTALVGAAVLLLTGLVVSGLFMSGVIGGAGTQDNGTAVAKIEKEQADLREQARLEEQAKETEKRKQQEDERRKEEARKEALAEAERIAAEKLSGEKKSLTLEQEIINSIGMKFRLIHKGSFLMGSPADEADREDDEAQHRVEISQDFYLGKYEVTQGEWKSVMGTEPWKGEDFVKAGAGYPATYVSWDDAVEFCTKLSSRDGVDCRGGSDSAYSFGADASDLGRHAWFDKNAYNIDEEYAHEVGLKRGNGFSLHDMHGNVYEWCGDYYESEYYSNSPKRDPMGPSDGSIRVSRGGSWFISSLDCRSANRNGSLPDGQNFILGFRVLRSSIK